MDELASIKGFIQSVKTSPWHISIRLRHQGQTCFLLLPRGGKKTRLFLTSKEFPPELRCNDKLREKLKSTILNCFLNDISFKKGVVCLSLSKHRESFMIMFYYADSKLYFGIFQHDKAYLLYRRKQVFKYSDISLSEFYSKEVSFLNNNTRKRNEIFIDHIKDYSSEVFNFYSTEKINNNLLKKNSRKLEAIKRDIKKLEEAILLKDDLIKGNVNVLEKQEKFIYKSLKFNLSRFSGIYTKRDFLFNKCKAYEKAISIQQKRLKEITGRDSKIVFNLNNVLVLPAKSEFPSLVIKKNNDIGLTFFGSDGEVYKFGRNVKENIEIRKNWAIKSDYWFHVESKSSAHCFLRLKNNPEKIKISHLEFVCEQFCNLEKQNSIDIVYGLVKNLKSVPGESGTVIMSKPKYFRYVSSSIR